MILDKLDNAHRYLCHNKLFEKAFEYLANLDDDNLEIGKIEIQGDDIFAMINKYETKDINSCLLEAHEKYIDIQYIISGTELVGYVPLEGQTPTKPYNEDKDVVFYNEEVSLFKLEEKMFAIFFPTDLHMPCIKEHAGQWVTKVVVKIKV